MKQPMLLIVDDNHGIARGIAHLVRGEFTPLTACAVRPVLAMLDAADVVLTDMDLGSGGDGRDIVDACVADGTIVVAMSADPDALLDLPCPTLPKPFEPSALLEVLLAAIRD